MEDITVVDMAQQHILMEVLHIPLALVAEQQIFVLIPLHSMQGLLSPVAAVVLLMEVVHRVVILVVEVE